MNKEFGLMVTNFFQCREIGYEVHEEVLKALHELHTAMKTHHSYQSEFRATESKLEVKAIFTEKKSLFENPTITVKYVFLFSVC